MKHWLVNLFILNSLLASSQQITNYSFRHIDQSNGLLHNEVLSITQDNQGFIWIGTTDGLQRFDGNRFLNYQNELTNGDKTNFAVDNIYADKEDQLWLSSNYHLVKLQLRKNTFFTYTNESILQDPDFKYVSYSDSQNHPWLLGDFAVYQFNSSTKKMQPYTLDFGPATFNKSGNIIKDSTLKQTWVATWNGLLLFDMKTKKVYQKTDTIDHALLKLYMPNGFSKIMIDRLHNIWLTGWDNLLYRYNPVTKKIITYTLSNSKNIGNSQGSSDGVVLANSIYQDNRDNIWVGTQNAGLLKYNRQTDNFDRLISNEENRNGLQYNYNIFCIFQDRDDNIWIGTDKGINIFNPYHHYFQSIHHQQNGDPSIPKNEINGFVETKNGNILVGTWGGGLSLYDSNLHFKKNILFKGAPENNLIWSFIKDSDEKIWIGCQHGYLHIYDPKTDKIIQTIHPNELDSSTIRCMQMDRKGNIYFGLHNGKIAGWDKALKHFFSYNNSLPDSSLFSAPVYNIFIDDHQNFWIGTGRGLKQFDPVTKKYSAVYSPVKNQPGSISAQSIRGMAQFNDSTLLIGTINGGLNFFNTNRRVFSTFSKELSSASIHSIKQDSYNNFWVTTDYDLYKLKINEQTTTAYNIDAGLVNSSFESVNFIQQSSGRWVTATSTEVIFFYPESLTRQSNQTTNVTFTGFRIFDQPVFIDSLLAEKKPVRLKYNQNFFTIEFAALDFSNVQQTKYFYQLSGIDKSWVNAAGKNFASYTNLQEGNYTFSVKAEEGGATLQSSSFTIVITPPFWKTWWFRSAIVLISAFLIYLIIIKRIKQIRHEASLKQKITETEMQALRAQMNPHFIFNCLNAIDNLIQMDQKDKATTYLARFAKLIRLVLDSSKNNVVPFYKEFEAMSLFLQLEQFRCSNKFTYQLNADDEILNGDYKVPPLLVQPFIENAIHHGLMNKMGSDKKLSVNIGIESETIKYTITDNGVGRQRALQIKNLNKPEHISYGIQISKERVSLFNKHQHEKDVVITDLYNNGEPAGTVVEVYINTNIIL